MTWKASFLALALTACASAAAQTHAPDGAPDWISGYWLSCEGNQHIAENWITSGHTMLGTNLMHAPHSAYEFLRIAPDAQGRLTYFSMPNGRAPPTAFAMTAHEGQRIVFENPAHDAPQRIIYWREGDELRARIEQMDGSGQITWVFRRAAPDARCPL